MAEAMTTRDVLRIARIVTIVTGAVMILFSYAVPVLGGAVNAYLTIIAIMDMPLFIIAIVYGLLWKRANWNGAIVGYTAGALAGVIGQFVLRFDFNLTTFISAGVTLGVTPVVSLLTRKPDESKLTAIWKAKSTSEEEIESRDVYHVFPRTVPGRLSLGVYVSGFILFLTGVLLGSGGIPAASVVAVLGMGIYFAGGLLRAYTD